MFRRPFAAPARHLVTAAGTVAVALLAVAGNAGTAAAAVVSANTLPLAPSCSTALPGQVHCNLRLTPSHRASHAAATGSVQSNLAGTAYGATDLQSAYNLRNANMGWGMTVAVVDAYDDPAAEHDLNVYRASYGLPACTSASGCFRKVNQAGGATPPTADADWGLEIATDIEMASATCPNCRILLVEASSPYLSDIMASVDEATALGANVVSMSLGASESSSDPSQNYHFSHHGVAYVASSGDSGYGTQFPAASPYVTAVGGTTLTRNTTSPRGWTETAWSGAGSGCSPYQSKPAWQHDSGCSTRSIADTSAVADPSTPVAVYYSIADAYAGTSASQPWTGLGGTSVAAPLVAGMAGVYGGEGSQTGGSIWYSGVTVNDVTSGSNAASCIPTYECTAGPGYDGPTGVGTPANSTSAAVATQTVNAATFTLTWSPDAGLAWAGPLYTIWERSNGAAWMQWTRSYATSATFYGVAGQSYDFFIETSGSGFDSGPPVAATAGGTVTVASNASHTLPFKSLYAIDQYGVLHPGSSPPQLGSQWTGNIVRGVALDASGGGGYTLDLFGGLHPFGDAPAPGDQSSHYWLNFDIARSVVLRAQGGGYVLDGWGGLHPFGGAPDPGDQSNHYWPGFDIARAVVLRPDGNSGYVLDGYGGLHPFGGAPDLGDQSNHFWNGFNIAHSVALGPNGTSGYVLDGFGGAHQFGGAPDLGNQSNHYWLGWDIARAIVLIPGSGSAGYILDGYSGMHEFGGAPAVTLPNYGVNGGTARAMAIS